MSGFAVIIDFAGQPVDPAIDQVNSLVNMTVMAFGIKPDSVYLTPAPLYHAAPLRFNMWVMRVGGTCAPFARDAAPRS